MKFIFYIYIFALSTNLFAVESCGNLESLGEIIYQELNQVRPKIISKKEIKIAVIDTGIDFNNKELISRVWTPSEKVDIKNYGYDAVNDTNSPQDKHGHGTHIAGIILSLFPQAKILPIKYYSSEQTSEENIKSIVKALKYAIEAKVDIINISGGGSLPDSNEHELVKLAKRKGILIVSAAGNNGKILSNKDSYYPAQYNESNILSVMNINKKGFRSLTSNYGKEIEISALGESVPSYGLGECIVRMTGTSQSTAIVTAYAAMIKAVNPEFKYSEIKEFILKNNKKTKETVGTISFNNIFEEEVQKKFQITEKIFSILNSFK